MDLAFDCYLQALYLKPFLFFYFTIFSLVNSYKSINKGVVMCEKSHDYYQCIFMR